LILSVVLLMALSSCSICGGAALVPETVTVGGMFQALTLTWVRPARRPEPVASVG
jgi:hypothetical protein